jgi:hypothetical protein
VQAHSSSAATHQCTQVKVQYAHLFIYIYVIAILLLKYSALTSFLLPCAASRLVMLCRASNSWSRLSCVLSSALLSASAAVSAARCSAAAASAADAASWLLRSSVSIYSTRRIYTHHSSRVNKYTPSIIRCQYCSAVSQTLNYDALIDCMSLFIHSDH